MFAKEIYSHRRRVLADKVGKGLILLPGNNAASYNYPNNTYNFRQDSCFLYYFGLRREGLIGIIDIDNDREYVFGNDIDINDIIWYGYVPSVKELATTAAVCHTGTMDDFRTYMRQAAASGQTVHFLPQYRHDTMIMLSDLLDFHPLQAQERASVPLIKAIIAMRSVKQPEEIAELEEAAEIGYAMHMAVRQECCDRVTEKHIAGVIEGIALSRGEGVSFPSIVTMHGEIQHGHPSYSRLEAGRLLLCDAGAENKENYCSDNTRVVPVSGTFTQQQKGIYQAVVAAHDWVLENARPDIKWLDIHLGACRVLTEHLQQLNLIRGNADDAVAAGAHTLFLPHGIGHHMGLDVHDMEGLGQLYVGFDDEVQPSTEFGLSCLRCGRRLQQGFVMTDEPGCYFIPALIDQWKQQNMHADFINYDEIERYRDFGGIRIEDDILITADGNRIIGKDVIPYHL